MRMPRIYGKGLSAYSITVRAIDGQFLFDSVLKQLWVQDLYLFAQFCGVTILVHAEMDNHFHILVLVPDRLIAHQNISADELLRRYAILRKHHKLEDQPGLDTMRDILTGGGTPAQSARDRLLQRMHCPSQFIKAVKERFTRRYNAMHERSGTIWEGRPDISLVEIAAPALIAVSTYIDLNPMRAGIVKNPALCPHCSYSRALNADPDALHGIRTLMDLCGIGSADDALQNYTACLAAASLYPRPGKACLCYDEARAFFGIQTLRQVPLITFGPMPDPGHPRRWWSRGMVIGSDAFVTETFLRVKGTLPYRRDRHPSPIEEPGAQHLAVLRRPRKLKPPKKSRSAAPPPPVAPPDPPPDAPA